MSRQKAGCAAVTVFFALLVLGLLSAWAYSAIMGYGS